MTQSISDFKGKKGVNHEYLAFPRTLYTLRLNHPRRPLSAEGTAVTRLKSIAIVSTRLEHAKTVLTGLAPPMVISRSPPLYIENK